VWLRPLGGRPGPAHPKPSLADSYAKGSKMLPAVNLPASATPATSPSGGNS
jgi:hypothetical protein